MNNETILKLKDLFENGDFSESNILKITDPLELVSLIETYKQTDLDYDYAESIIVETYNLSFEKHYSVLRENALFQTLYLQEVAKVPSILLEALIRICTFGYIDFKLNEILENDKFFQFLNKRYQEHVSYQNNVARAVEKLTDFREVLEQKDFLEQFAEQYKGVVGNQS